MTTDSTKTYYPYEAVTIANGSSFLAYTGGTIVQNITEDAPANASAWPPGEASTGFLNYFDGIGWTLGPDVTSMSLEALKALVLNKVNDEFQSTINALSAGYPSNEQKSWSQQLADAQAVLAGGAPSVILSALAAARSTDVKDLAQKIVAKNDAWTAAYAEALATLQKARAAIEAATQIGQLPPLTVHDVVLHTLY